MMKLKYLILKLLVNIDSNNKDMGLQLKEDLLCQLQNLAHRKNKIKILLLLSLRNCFFEEAKIF